MTTRPMIENLETRPGKEWTQEEREACCGWLMLEKWSDLERLAARALQPTPADDRAGVLAAFLNGELDSVLDGYKPGHNGLWPYIVVCFRRYCWRAAKQLSRERGLTRPIEETQAELVFEAPGSPGAGAPPDSLLSQEFQELVQRKFANLDPRYREPLLRRTRGAAYEEIARDLGLSVAVVKIRIFRARQKLRKALRTEWPKGNF